MELEQTQVRTKEVPTGVMQISQVLLKYIIYIKIKGNQRLVKKSYQVMVKKALFESSGSEDKY